MENKKKFLYNGIMLTAVGIAMRTAAMFFNAFVTQKIGAEGMGLYTIVMTVYGFAVTFATSGISLTGLLGKQIQYRKQHHKQRLLKQRFQSRIKCLVLGRLALAGAFDAAAG